MCTALEIGSQIGPNDGLNLLVHGSHGSSSKQVDTFQGALGESHRSLHIEEPSERVFYNSRWLGSKQSWKPNGSPVHEGSRKQSVQVVTVDQLLSHVDRVDFIRISSQQSISAALLGAANSLQRFQPWLLVELDGQEEELRNVLERNQYECSWSY